MSVYRELFRISLEHAYYDGQPFAEWELTAGAGTRALMARTGLLVRRVTGAAVFLLPDDRTAQLRDHIAAAGGTFPFLLCVYPEDPYFAGYTAPVVPPGQVLVADSRDAVPQPAAGERLHCGVCLDHLALVNADDVRATRALAGAGNGGPARRPAVIVHIALSADGVAGPPRAFVVRFDAASSYWKYYVRGALAARALAIADLDAAVAFRRVGDEAEVGRAAVFLSDAPIALRARPGQRFQLRERAAFGDRILMKRMPVASAGLRQRAVVDGQAVLVSEIFINQ